MQLLERALERLPELTVVLNHLGFWPDRFHADEHGRPRFDTAYTTRTWRPSRPSRASRASTSCAPACTRSPREPCPYDDLRPVIARLLDAFGPQRLLLGSDFPWIRGRRATARRSPRVDSLLGGLDEAARAPSAAGTRWGSSGLSGELYRAMLTIRRFEERVVDLVNANEIAGVTHEYVGQEAVAVGVCAALRPDDVITSTHRGHGHLIAKGADVRRMMAELLGREDGLNRGRGGSMHVADLGLGIYGANGIVAAGAPFAAGAAWSFSVDGSGRVAVTFFGDGGANQGVLHETMNLAALWRLPLVFVCENNGYAVTLPQERSTAGSIVARAAAYGMAAEQVDGMDVDAVLDAAERAVAARARAAARRSSSASPTGSSDTTPPSGR